LCAWRKEYCLEIIRVGTVTNDYFPDEEKHYITIWMLSEYAGGEPSIMEPEKCEAQEWYTFDTLPEPLFAWDTLKASGLLEQLRTEMHS
jgi:8-oxo-dGTP diphosphatase